MRIINAMFGRGLGGLEQSFLDYCEALWVAGHDVVAFVHPDAKVRPRVQAMPISTLSMRNRGQWDFYAVYRMGCALRRLAPDAIICHGNRALSLMKKASSGRFPVIGVTHNYQLSRFTDLAGVFALTADLTRAASEKGADPNRIFYIPNMIVLQGGGFVKSARKSVPCIGAMGRFVEKKGFDVYLEALALLKNRGYTFRAILAGSGEEQQKLIKQAQTLGLEEDILHFAGWVEDKQAFFREIDIFCLPSRHEPFGIVLLEAFAHKTPVVSTDSEGPADIATKNQLALMVPKNDPAAMAEAMARLLDNEAEARDMATRAFEAVKTTYNLQVVSHRIDEALRIICHK